MAAAAVLAGTAAFPYAAAAVTPPSGFATTTEISGLTRPSKIAWAPDGRRFVAEKDGVLKVAAPGSSTAQTVLDLRTEVASFNDRGLLGMALDTSFASNGYVYLLFTFDLNHATPDRRDTSAPTVSQLRRYTINASSQVVGGSMKILLGSHTTGPCPAASNDLDCIPADGDSHSIGTVLSAPDGSLFVGSGDAASYSRADDLSLRAYDEQSMAGKILHIDREGRGLAGHSFCPQDTNLDHVCTKVYAKGFRNPFRFTRLSDGALLVGDVGWGAYEELDVIRSGGRSFGWPCYEGPVRTSTWRDRPVCAAEYAKEGTASAHVEPVYAYRHTSEHPSWAVIAGPEYTGSAYPAQYRGSLFFGDYGAGFLKRLSLATPPAPAVASDFATDWGSVDLTAAPNGDIAWVDLAGWSSGAGFVERLVYSGTGNRKPNAVAEGNPASGPIPLDVSFAGTGSSDPDGDQLTYDWDFGDGSAHSTAANPTHRYTQPGTYEAALTVSDGELSDVDTVTVNAGNTPPDTPVIEVPAAGSTYRDGAALTVRGTATDPNQGALPASAFEWNVRIVHKDHEHLLMSPTGVKEFELTPVRDHGADSYYVIDLKVSDAHGATASAEREIHPETVPLRLRSEPPGAPLSFAGVAVTAPWDGPAAIGFEGTVSAADTFTHAGRKWSFAGWSNRAERIHDLIVPASETVLTATYTPVAGPAQGGGGARSADLAGPVIRPRALSSRLTLSGFVDDPAGVESVRLGVARLQGGGRCRWLVGSPIALGRRARCAPRRWVAARLRGHRWSLALPRRLPAGRYRAWLLAADRLGNVSRHTADGRGQLRFKVAVRVSGRRALSARRHAKQPPPQWASFPGALLEVLHLRPDHLDVLLGRRQSFAQFCDLRLR